MKVRFLIIKILKDFLVVLFVFELDFTVRKTLKVLPKIIIFFHKRVSKDLGFITKINLLLCLIFAHFVIKFIVLASLLKFNFKGVSRWNHSVFEDFLYFVLKAN